MDGLSGVMGGVGVTVPLSTASTAHAPVERCAICHQPFVKLDPEQPWTHAEHRPVVLEGVLRRHGSAEGYRVKVAFHPSCWLDLRTTDHRSPHERVSALEAAERAQERVHWDALGKNRGGRPRKVLTPALGLTSPESPVAAL